jgi:putative transposase
LQERISAYKQERKSVSYVDQTKSITTIRAEHPEYAAINAQSLQVTAKRLELAFQHFFRRVREGEKQCGFPRFKSKQRYKGFGYKTHNDGWKFISDGKHHTLRLSGVGMMRMRGKSRNEGG